MSDRRLALDYDETVFGEDRIDRLTFGQIDCLDVLELFHVDFDQCSLIPMRYVGISTE